MSAPEPRDIRLETPHFVLRPLTEGDANERVAAWLADPRKAAMINAPVKAMTVDGLRRFIASHDRRVGHLLGIFAKDGGTLVGFWAAYIDWAHREFQLNVLVGERGRVSAGAQVETQHALLDHFFDEVGLTHLRVSVLARNRFMDRYLRENGAVLEHTSWRSDVDGSGEVLELHDYRADQTVWHALRARLKARGAYSASV
jgi:RimJ/RimL family protein N-acetyltransferase